MTGEASARGARHRYTSNVGLRKGLNYAESALYLRREPEGGASLMRGEGGEGGGKGREQGWGAPALLGDGWERGGEGRGLEVENSFNREIRVHGKMEGQETQEGVARQGDSGGGDI